MGGRGAAARLAAAGRARARPTARRSSAGRWPRSTRSGAWSTAAAASTSTTPSSVASPAAAFGLWTAARLAADWRAEAPHLLDRVDWPPLARLARALARRAETEAANQQAAALAGLALAAREERFGIARGAAEPHAARLFASQHAEGWFPVHGGPDFGYLTVTLDALADYEEATGDPRAAAAAERAVDFLAALVGADGCLPRPSTATTPTTSSPRPGHAATRSPRAAWLVKTLFDGAANPAHFLAATDDRYHAHYLYASCLRALPHLEKLAPPEAPPQRGAVWFPGCGHLAHPAPDGSWTAYVAAKKGGVVHVHRRGAPPLAEHGWRLGEGERLWTSNWWSEAWQVEKKRTAR